MSAFQLQIFTPEETRFSGDAERLTLRAESGDITILPGHIPCGISVTGGKGSFTADGARTDFTCGRGILQVEKERVKLLICSFSQDK